MLKFHMGLPQNSSLVITDSLDKEAVKNLENSNLNADPSNRIEYNLLKSQQQLQKFNVKRYRGQYLPSLFAYGSLNTMAQRSEFNIFNPDYKWYPTGVIGATLSFKLFDGAQREAKINQEKLSLRKIDNEMTDLENAINLEVSSSSSRLKDAISTLKIQEETLDLASSVSTTTKVKYEQGVGTNLEVLDAETSLKEAQVNYFNALYNAVIAKIDLDKATGTFKY